MIIKLTIPKDICNRDQDKDLYLTKDTISTENWLFLWEYLDYKIYYIKTDFRCRKRIYPDFMFGKYYLFKCIELLNGINQNYPGTMIIFVRK